MRVVASLLMVLAISLGARSASADARPLVLWHAYNGDEERALVQLAKLFSARHDAPAVAIELLSIPFDAYYAKLEAAVPHSHGPDVFIEPHERLGSDLKNGIVVPAGDAFPDEDVALYDRTAVLAVSEGGVRYAVPLASKCLALYVNDALYPGSPGSRGRGPDTLEELALMRATLPADVYPLAYEAYSAYYHVPFLHAFGGQMLDAEQRFAMVGPGAARSLSFVRELVKGRVVPDEPSGALVQQLFASGNAVAAISGPWFAANLKGVKYHVVPLPRIAEAGSAMRPFLTVDGVFLTKAGAANADARAFARFLGGPDAAKIRATVGHQVVATTSAWAEPEVIADALLTSFHEAAKDAVPTPTSTAMHATWVPAEDAIKRVMRGDATPEDALTDARADFDDVMRAQPPDASPTGFVIILGLVLLAGAFFAVRRARAPGFRRELRASLPAYKYVAHAALAIFVLVVLPLLAGALTSLFVGTRDSPRFVGFANYVSILTARGGPLLGHQSFYLTLLVTVLWTVANVALHVAIGLTLGVLLSRPLLRMKAMYRVLLILPWAVPSYVTALAWKGMFHRQFGAINAILDALGVERVSWFSHFSTAFAANVTTNVWLGFPFMMVVTLGALTSISKDVLEAAEVDGATRWQRFRLVTLPLLRPALLPAVVLGAVWTFNMFNVVFLVSGGEPYRKTDILVSEAYRWAFTRDAQYGYAAAYAVLIFVLLAGGSRLLGRLSGKADEAIA